MLKQHLHRRLVVLYLGVFHLICLLNTHIQGKSCTKGLVIYLNICNFPKSKNIQYRINKFTWKVFCVKFIISICIFNYMNSSRWHIRELKLNLFHWHIYSRPIHFTHILLFAIRLTIIEVRSAKPGHMASGSHVLICSKCDSWFYSK